MATEIGAGCVRIWFFHGDEASPKASIVDPHGIHLADALPKLRGLADFTEAYGNELHHIEAIAKMGTQLRVLDLKNAKVRGAGRAADDIQQLYGSEVAGN